MKQSKKSQACPGISETQHCPNTETPGSNKSAENAYIPKTEESVHCPKVSEISHNSCERSETSQRSQHKQDTGPWQEYLTSSTSHSSGEAKPQEFSSYQGQGRTQEYSRSQGQGSSAEDFRTNKSMDNSNTKRERPVFHQVRFYHTILSH